MPEPDRDERTPKGCFVAIGVALLALGALAFFFYYLTHSGAVG